MDIVFIRDATEDTEPCPFRHEHEDGENERRSLMALKAGPVLMHYIKCESCAATGPVSATWAQPDMAIGAWNGRK